MTRLVSRTAFVALAAAIVFLSVVPPLWRPVTSAPHSIEHLLVFIPAGVTLALAYPWRWWAQASMLSLFAVAIEAAQLLAPGRHARWSDLAIHLAGGAIGLAVAHFAAGFSRSARRGPAASDQVPR